MNINRNNYEEFLLLYADNELSFSERQVVEDFLEANPDLKTELQLLMNSKLHTEHIPFINKFVLYKNESFITTENYESYFLLYADNELTEGEKRETEKYAASSPALQQQFELIKQTKLVIDKEIVFADKAILYREEKPSRVIPFAWMRIAAAAVLIGVILLAGIKLLNKKPVGTEPVIVKKEIPSNNNDGNNNSTNEPKEAPVTAPQSSEEKNIAAVNDKPEERRSKDESSTKQQAINPKILQQNIAVLNSNVKENKKQKTTVTNQIIPPSSLVRTDDSKELKKVNNTTANNKAVMVPGATVKAGTPKELKATKEIVDIAVGPSEINNYLKTAVNKEEEETKTSVAIFSVSEDKVQKSGLRGLFRKVKRLVNRRNSNDEERDSKKIYIGNFAIARAQ